MLFNQLVLAELHGDGSPVDQTFWIDDLTVANRQGRPWARAPRPRATSGSSSRGGVQQQKPISGTGKGGSPSPPLLANQFRDIFKLRGGDKDGRAFTLPRPQAVRERTFPILRAGLLAKKHTCLIAAVFCSCGVLLAVPDQRTHARPPAAQKPAFGPPVDGRQFRRNVERECGPLQERSLMSSADPRKA